MVYCQAGLIISGYNIPCFKSLDAATTAERLSTGAGDYNAADAINTAADDMEQGTRESYSISSVPTFS